MALGLNATNRVGKFRKYKKAQKTDKHIVSLGQPHPVRQCVGSLNGWFWCPQWKYQKIHPTPKDLIYKLISVRLQQT